MRPATPEDLHTYWIRFAIQGDAAGLASLYEPDAVLIAPDGSRVEGRMQIQSFYEAFVQSAWDVVDGEVRRAIVNGGLAITSARQGDGEVTCEVARAQPDGGWLWVIDKPQFVTGPH